VDGQRSEEYGILSPEDVIPKLGAVQPSEGSGGEPRDTDSYSRVWQSL